MKNLLSEILHRADINSIDGVSCSYKKGLCGTIKLRNFPGKMLHDFIMQFLGCGICKGNNEKMGRIFSILNLVDDPPCKQRGFARAGTCFYKQIIRRMPDIISLFLLRQLCVKIDHHTLLNQFLYFHYYSMFLVTCTAKTEKLFVRKGLDTEIHGI